MSARNTRAGKQFRRMDHALRKQLPTYPRVAAREVAGWHMDSKHWNKPVAVKLLKSSKGLFPAGGFRIRKDPERLPRHMELEAARARELHNAWKKRAKREAKLKARKEAQNE